jgi:hypothetical protein
MSDRTYIQIPGDRTHELPPLLIHPLVNYGDADIGSRLDEVVDLAGEIVDSEDMIPATPEDEGVVEQRKYDLALQLAEKYLGLVAHWQWGDSILEWIRQCEITFGAEETLRKLLHPDLWPHASRSSFVTLLAEKAVPTHGVGLEKAVGLRLTFRQPPPIDCFSNQFLIYLDSTVAGSAYNTWSHMVSAPPALLPPERFHFQVHELKQ